MSVHRLLAVLSVVLWCVALFLPCCSVDPEAPPDPGWMGLLLAVYTIPVLFGIPPVVTNLAVLWATIEAAAGCPVVTRGGGQAVVVLSALAMGVTVLSVGDMFAWGAYVWLASVGSACVLMLLGPRITWRELDGPAADWE